MPSSTLFSTRTTKCAGEWAMNVKQSNLVCKWNKIGSTVIKTLLRTSARLMAPGREFKLKFSPSATKVMKITNIT